LKSDHSFSFAGFYDTAKMGFGLLRVLNDDRVAGGMGFGTHPHDNMEIISIPLAGSLKHRDDMGNSAVINTDEVQIMSAGTGVKHSEFNNSQNEAVNFLQLWILPEKQGITPRYEQKHFPPEDRVNRWQLVVAPDNKGAVWINQQAYLSRAILEANKTLDYQLHSGKHGGFVFLLEGRVKIEDQYLESRDALGLWDTDKFSIQAIASSEILLIEVPMID
jgi:redox-sensitive bicupin YhaK (pirin superfamily)